MRVPEQLMRAMAAEAEAARNARAKVFVITTFITSTITIFITFSITFFIITHLHDDDNLQQHNDIQVIAAEGEHKASRSLRLAAEVIADSPAALQVGHGGGGDCDN